jgi:hypothetical protein
MQRFFAVLALLLIAFASTSTAIKCYRCSDEKSCQNPEQVSCSDDLGCQKLTNTKPYLYSKGCFNPIGCEFFVGFCGVDFLGGVIWI